MNRRSFLKILSGMTLAGFFVAFWSFWINPAWRLRVRKWQIRTPKWTAKPLRIVVLSDLHLGEPHVTLSRLETVVAQANRQNGDVILLLGDYEAGHRFVSAHIPPDDYAAVLAKLKAPLGRYAILGNHDFWEDQDALARQSGPVKSQVAFEKVGIPVLENDAIKLGEGEAAFWICGLGDQLAWFTIRDRKPGLHIGVDDLEGTLGQADADAPIILAAHEPDIFPKVPDHVALTLSGHTHGGQVRLFGWSPRVPSRYGNRYAYGHVRENRKDIVISGGVGCSILPVRFGVPPEVTVIEISA